MRRQRLKKMLIFMRSHRDSSQEADSSPKEMADSYGDISVRFDRFACYFLLFPLLSDNACSKI